MDLSHVYFICRLLFFLFIYFLKAIHEGLNCKEFQEQLKRDSPTSIEAKRTKKMLEVKHGFKQVDKKKKLSFN
jgi:hypothetical protein